MEFFSAFALLFCQSKDIMIPTITKFQTMKSICADNGSLIKQFQDISIMFLDLFWLYTWVLQNSFMDFLSKNMDSVQDSWNQTYRF